MNVTAYKAISDLNRVGVLWHGLNAERALEVLNQGFIKPHSVQRFWSDGMFYEDNHPSYDSSIWCNGWSMSRDLQVAKKFAMRGIIFAFNIQAIKQQFKVVPYSWAGAIPNSSPFSRKKEREEYVLSGGIFESEAFYEQKAENILKDIADVNKKHKQKEISLKEKKALISEFEQKLKEASFKHHFYMPHGKVMPLEKAFGFFISEKRPSEDVCVNLEKHPLFLGYL